MLLSNEQLIDFSSDESISSNILNKSYNIHELVQIKHDKIKNTNYSSLNTDIPSPYLVIVINCLKDTQKNSDHQFIGDIECEMIKSTFGEDSCLIFNYCDTSVILEFVEYLVGKLEELVETTDQHDANGQNGVNPQRFKNSENKHTFIDKTVKIEHPEDSDSSVTITKNCVIFILYTGYGNDYDQLSGMSKYDFSDPFVNPFETSEIHEALLSIKNLNKISKHLLLLFYYDIIRCKSETNTPLETQQTNTYLHQKANLVEFYDESEFRRVEVFENQACRCITCYDCSKRSVDSSGEIVKNSLRQVDSEKLRKYWKNVSRFNTSSEFNTLADFNTSSRFHLKAGKTSRKFRRNSNSDENELSRLISLPNFEKTPVKTYPYNNYAIYFSAPIEYLNQTAKPLLTQLSKTIRHLVVKNKVSLASALSTLPMSLSPSGKKIIPEESCFDEESVWWGLPNVNDNFEQKSGNACKLDLPAGTEWVQDALDGSVHVVDYVKREIDPKLVVAREKFEFENLELENIPDSLLPHKLLNSVFKKGISTQTTRIAAKTTTCSSQTETKTTTEKSTVIEPLTMSQRRFTPIHREFTTGGIMNDNKNVQTESSRSTALRRLAINKFSVHDLSRENDDNDDVRSNYSVQVRSSSRIGSRSNKVNLNGSGRSEIGRQTSFSGGSVYNSRNSMSRSSTQIGRSGTVNRSSTFISPSKTSLQHIRQKNPFLNQKITRQFQTATSSTIPKYSQNALNNTQASHFRSQNAQPRRQSTHQPVINRSRTGSFSTINRCSFEPRVQSNSVNSRKSAFNAITEMNNMMFERGVSSRTKNSQNPKNSQNLSQHSKRCSSRLTSGDSNVSKYSLPKSESDRGPGLHERQVSEILLSENEELEKHETNRSHSGSEHQGSGENSEYHSDSGGVSKCVSPEIERKAAVSSRVHSQISSRIVVLTSDSDTSETGSHLAEDSCGFRDESENSCVDEEPENLEYFENPHNTNTNNVERHQSNSNHSASDSPDTYPNQEISRSIKGRHLSGSSHLSNRSGPAPAFNRSKSSSVGRFMSKFNSVPRHSVEKPQKTLAFSKKKFFAQNQKKNTRKPLKSVCNTLPTLTLIYFSIQSHSVSDTISILLLIEITLTGASNQSMTQHSRNKPAFTA